MTLKSRVRHPQLAVRDPFVPLVLLAIGMAAALVKGLPRLYISATMASIPVEWHPLEYIPVTVGLLLTLYFAPRFRLWELLGTRRISIQAFTTTVIILVIPFSMSLLAALSYPDSDMNPRLLSTNVLAACALASILIGVLGRLWGLIAFLATYYGSIVLAAELPQLARYGPRTLFFLEAEVYDQVQWAWILTLITFALLYAWTQRSIPIRKN